MLDRQAYIENLLDYYQNPRNKGRIEDGIARRIGFEGQGCTISQAGASMVAEKYEGEPIETIEQASTDDMIDEMGREVVISRVRCAAVGIGTLKGAIQQYRKDKILEEIEAGRTGD